MVKVLRTHSRLILIVLVICGCGWGQSLAVAAQAPRQGQIQGFGEVAKVKVDRAGTITLNGKAVTIEVLKQELARLKQVNGAVWYYRENPQGEPPPQAMAVIEAISDARLPVRLMERDFD